MNDIMGLFLFLFYTATQISQSAMDFFAVCLLLGSAALFFKNPNSRSFLSAIPAQLKILIAGWIIWVVMGLLVQTDMNLKESLVPLFQFHWIINAMSLLILLQSVTLTEKNLKGLLLVFALTSGFAISVTVLGFNPAHPSRTLDIFSGGLVRTGGFLGQPIIYGHLMALYFCFFSGLLVARWKNKKVSQMLLGTLIIAGAALILNFTRGAWISIAGALLTFAALKNKRSFQLTALGMFGVFTILYFAWTDFANRIHYAFVGGDGERLQIWRANWLMFTEHPFMGVGWERNVELLPEYYAKIGAPMDLLVSHAHNQYLHLLSGTGIVGLMFYILFLAQMIKLNLNYLRWAQDLLNESWHKGIALGGLGAQISLVLGGLTEANFVHSKIKYTMILFWTLIIIGRQKLLRSQQ